jgi:hypothetical protein
MFKGSSFAVNIPRPHCLLIQKPSNTMKTFQILSFFALVASAMAFAPVDPKSESIPVALISGGSSLPRFWTVDRY